MYLVRLLYASEKSKHFQEVDLELILKSARNHNKKNNVTGCLCFNRNYFLQCLEGSRTKVNETYHRILNDHRHDKIVLLDYREIPQREFGEWFMGYLPETKTTRPLNLKYSPHEKFIPHEMSGESSHRYLLEMSGLVDII